MRINQLYLLVSSIVVCWLGTAYASDVTVPQAHPGTPLSVHADTALTPESKQALRNLARTLPCTAAALILGHPDMKNGAEEVLYLDETPSADRIEAMFRQREAGSASDSSRNPYSSSLYLVEVRWSWTHPEDDVLVLNVRAQLVKRDGTALAPAHWVEPPVTLRISSTELTILPGDLMKSPQINAGGSTCGSQTPSTVDKGGCSGLSARRSENLAQD